MMSPITQRKDVANMPYLEELMRDLYPHNGSGLVIRLYKARTWQTVTKTFVNTIARGLGLRTTSAARAAAIRKAKQEPRNEPHEICLSRRFLSMPAPPDLRGKHYYGQ